MTDRQASLKQLSRIALAALAVLAVGGIVFYKERLFFADASYIAFYIIKDGHLDIQEHRYGSFITQMIPWLGNKLHFPMKVTLKAYAFSFNFFYLLAGCIIYKCRQYGLLILFAFYNLLVASDSFFWTNNEVHQGIAWMFLCFAVVLRMGELKTKLYFLLPVFIALAFVALYTHFLVLIPFTFLWFFLWVKQDGWPFKKWISVTLTVVIFAIVLSKFLVVEDHHYDDAKLRNVLHVDIRGIYTSFAAPCVLKFYKLLLTNYWTLVLVLVSGIAAAWRRKPVLLFWTVVTFIGYLSLIGITYPHDDNALFYMESEWQGIGIVGSAAFVYFVLPAIDAKRAMVLLCLIFIVRCAYIGAASSKFRWRTDFTREVLKRMRAKGISKLAMVSDPELRDRYLLDWGVSNESMLMSIVHGDKPQLTFSFVSGGDTALISKLRDPHVVLASFDIITPEHWNYEYFQPDTSHPYVVTTYREFFNDSTKN